MEILGISYNRVHGFLSENIEFHRGENFLVGINGCGKTTALNLLRWMLTPDFPQLCSLDHEFIKVRINHDSKSYEILSKIDPMVSCHVMSLTDESGVVIYPDIETPLTQSPSTIKSKLHHTESLDSYKKFGPEPHEIETWKFLLELLPSPVFVGLRRGIDHSSLKPQTRLFSKSQALDRESQPTEIANNIMRDSFNTARRKILQINDDLNQKVLELSFSGVIKPEGRNSDEEKDKWKSQITRLTKRLEQSIESSHAHKNIFSDTNIKNAALRYLAELSAILKQSSDKEDLFIFLNYHNFNRAAKMLSLFESQEKKIEDALSEITKFKQSVNEFLSDSLKAINFDQNTGAPFFTSESKPGEKIEISELSSGELQIVVLMSYFAFLAQKGTPIIIDEPELSLHVQWQEKFIHAVKSIMPAECQTIMATHSPEICGADDINIHSLSIKK